MTGLFSPRVVPWVEHMAPYAAPEDPSTLAAHAGIPESELVKLDANENPYGPSPRVREALATFAGYHLYPDPEQKAIRPLVAAYAGVDPALVMLGNGSDELIDLLCRIYLQPEDEVVDCTPTFGMYRFSTELCGGTLIEAPRDADWHVDAEIVEGALSPRTKLIFVAAPNNPSGNRVDPGTLQALLATGRIVVLDEAYVEFSDGPSHAPLVTEHDNLVVLRTFSKWAGLAGARVGYGVFPPHILTHLWKVKPPFNVNLGAQVAVRATLDDLSYARRAIALIKQERARLIEGLAGIEGVRVWPSEANFVLAQVGAPGAAHLKAHLARAGIAVRAYGHPRLQEMIRISVGLPTHTDAVLAAIWTWRELS